MKKSVVLIVVLAMALSSVLAVAADDLYTVRMVYWPGPESDAMDVVLKYWNENMAEEAGFYVEQELFGRDNIMLKEEALMAAGSSDVDLFFTASRWLGKYWMHLEPLEPLITDPEINIYGTDLTKRIPATVDGMRWTDGTLYGVPMDLSAHFLYYRSDLIEKLLADADWQETYKKISLEQMGVEMTPKHPDEWTWDDYLATSFFFTKQYNPDSPVEYGNFTHGKVMGPTAFLWTNAYWSFGGDWFDADGKVAFDNEAARKALEIWKTSFGKGLTPPGSVNGEYAEDNEAFLAGQVALSVHWNAAYQTLDAEDSPIHGKIAVTAPPAGPEGRFAITIRLASGSASTASIKKTRRAGLPGCTATKPRSYTLTPAGSRRLFRFLPTWRKRDRTSGTWPTLLMSMAATCLRPPGLLKISPAAGCRTPGRTSLQSTKVLRRFRRTARRKWKTGNRFPG